MGEAAKSHIGSPRRQGGSPLARSGWPQAAAGC